jgi:hypothetical protein
MALPLSVQGPGVPTSPAARTTLVGVPSTLSMGRQPHTVHSSSPPVHDVRDILGDRAPTLHVGAKSVAAAPAVPAAAPAAPPVAQQ